MVEETPAVRYYRHHAGRWRGALTLRITDWRTFFAARIPWFERLQLIALALTPEALSPTMHTTVDLEPLERDGEVAHTTALTRFGVTLYRSQEWFRLRADGQGMDLRRVQHPFPRLGSALPEDHGAGHVEPDGRHARYDWSWYDRRLDQRTAPRGDGLEIVLRSDWSEARVWLRRVDASTRI